MTFGEKVKEVRHKLFLSQQAMAAKLNVAFTTVNRWERERTEPNFKAQADFDRLCKDNNINFAE